MSDPSFSPPTIEQLARLLPAYDFEAFIAQGGMGAVYKARQRSLDRDVAIKILPRELGADLEFRESFEREAKAMARLNHPNLIGVYDFGDADGMPYIVMEFVRGKSLFHSAYNKKIDPIQAVTIVKGICDGLAHAHEQGVIHRDIKPGNILLTPKAEPKIGDFGLARPAGGGHSGVVMGTPGYAAPEITQLPDHADRGSDIFALGVVLYELLVGRCPPYEDNPPLASSVCGCDPALDRICEKAAHPVVASRYASAEAMSAALDAWLRRQAGTAPAKVPAAPGPRQTPKAVSPKPGPPRPGPREVSPALSSSNETPKAVPQKPVPPRSGPREPLPAPSSNRAVFDFAKSLMVLAIVILISAIAWKKLRSLQDEKAAAERAYEESKGKIPKFPTAPGQDIPRSSDSDKPRPTHQVRSESAIDSLSRLKAKLASGDRDELPRGSVPLNGSDIMRVPTPMTWHAAAAFAESHGAQLVVITSSRDLERLSEMTSETRMDSWIGAGRNPAGGWSSVDGSPLQGVTLPDGKESFAVVNPDGVVQARRPDELHPFVIQWQRDGSNPGALGNTLRRTADSLARGEPVFPLGTVVFAEKYPVCLIPRAAGHAEAAEFARQAGGHLVVADTPQKNFWLADQLGRFGGDSGVWIGATRDGDTWKWATAAPMEFTRWEKEPTDANGGGVAIMVAGGAWRHASPGGQAAGFIIEWEHRAARSGSGELTDSDLPPAILQLEAKARTLLAGLGKEREKELATNTKNFASTLDTWLRRQNRAEGQRWASEVDALKLLVKANRIPGKIDQDSGIFLSEDMAEICRSTFTKQNAIDAGFKNKVAKLRDAYAAKLADAIVEAKGKGLTAQVAALDSALEKAADLDGWTAAFGLAPVAAEAVSAIPDDEESAEKDD